MTSTATGPEATTFEPEEQGPTLIELLQPAIERKFSVLGIALAIGVAVFGASYLIPTRFTAETVFIPPQQQQGGTAAALASLGALSSLVGGGGAQKNSPEEYIALMQSATVSDRIIKKFDLRHLWESKFQVDARKRLLARVIISVGKKDGLMRVDVTDTDPERAAAIANQYIEELRTLTNGLAITEAQQRRVFFQQLLEKTRDKLASAQAALEGSGFSAGALNAEPRSAADGYAKVRADLTAAQIKLQVARSSLADTAPEVRVLQETVNALTAQLAKLEAQDHAGAPGGDYVNRYREFKYEETLFDLFARQYESARVDESREGSLIQVIDPATPPERKSGPSHSLYGLVSFGVGLLLAIAGFALRGRRSMQSRQK